VVGAPKEATGNLTSPMGNLRRGGASLSELGVRVGRHDHVGRAGTAGSSRHITSMRRGELGPPFEPQLPSSVFQYPGSWRRRRQSALLLTTPGSRTPAARGRIPAGPAGGALQQTSPRWTCSPEQAAVGEELGEDRCTAWPSRIIGPFSLSTRGPSARVRGGSFCSARPSRYQRLSR
jgi:hypothetical protein